MDVAHLLALLPSLGSLAVAVVYAARFKRRRALAAQQAKVARERRHLRRITLRGRDAPALPTCGGAREQAPRHARSTGN